MLFYIGRNLNKEATETLEPHAKELYKAVEEFSPDITEKKLDELNITDLSDMVQVLNKIWILGEDRHNYQVFCFAKFLKKYGFESEIISEYEYNELEDLKKEGYIIQDYCDKYYKSD